MSKKLSTLFMDDPYVCLGQAHYSIINIDLIIGACPLLCGGHGDYKNGECECHPGWKGKECSLRHDECEVADCSGKCFCLKVACFHLETCVI